MELGMAVIGLAGILAYKRPVKRHGHTRKTPMSSNSNVRSDTDPVISRRHFRTRIARGMVKEWDMMAGKGMTHREIATMYGVSLVTVDRHLAGKSGKKAAKVKKASVSPTLLMIDREVEI